MAQHNEIYKKTFEILSKGFFNSLNFAASKDATTKELDKLARMRQEEIGIPNIVCSDIRFAIQSFYSAHGFNAFVMCNKSSRQLQIITSVKNPRNNLYIEILERWLNANKDQFANSIASRQLSESDIKNMLNFIREQLQVTDEQQSKDIIKGGIKRVFGFDERDGLFFNRLEVVFRRFDYEVVAINKALRQIQNKPYMSLDLAAKSKLERLCKNVNFEEIITQNTQEILAEQLDLKSVDVPTFSKMVSFICTSRLRISLHAIMSKSGVELTQQLLFCKKRVHEHRDSILDLIANSLCFLLYKNTYNANRFISFFDGKNRENEGSIIQIPSIYDDGKNWMVEEIKDIVRQKIGADESIRDLTDELKSVNEVLSGIDIEGYRSKIEARKKEISQLEQLQSSQVSELRNLNGSGLSQKTDIDNASNSVHKTIEKKLELINEVEHLEKTINLATSQKGNFTEQKANLESELNRLQASYFELSTRYNKMLRALSKAMSRSIEIYSHAS